MWKKTARKELDPKPWLRAVRELYKPLMADVVEETYRHLVPQDAGHLIEIYNELLDLDIAIRDTYAADELQQSLLYLRLWESLKEIIWLQLLFLTGNYLLLHRNLRYVWETMCQAFHIDTHFPGPGPELRVQQFQEAEEQKQKEGKWGDLERGWRLVKHVFHEAFPEVQGTALEESYHGTWRRLNEYVHPTKEILDKIFEHGGAALMTNQFDEMWARETLEAATMVFDFICGLILITFPESAPRFSKQPWAMEFLDAYFPLTRATLNKLAQSSG